MKLHESSLPNTAARKLTILLWGHNDLLQGSVEQLLCARPDWLVVSVPSDRDIEAFLREAEKLNPDVMVIQRDELSCEEQRVLAYMQQKTGLKVILFGLEDNALVVLNKKKVWMNKASDLISVVNS